MADMDQGQVLSAEIRGIDYKPQHRASTPTQCYI